MHLGPTSYSSHHGYSSYNHRQPPNRNPYSQGGDDSFDLYGNSFSHGPRGCYQQRGMTAANYCFLQVMDSQGQACKASLTIANVYLGNVDTAFQAFPTSQPYRHQTCQLPREGLPSTAIKSDQYRNWIGSGSPASSQAIVSTHHRQAYETAMAQPIRCSMSGEMAARLQAPVTRDAVARDRFSHGIREAQAMGPGLDDDIREYLSHIPIPVDMQTTHLPPWASNVAGAATGGAIAAGMKMAEKIPYVGPFLRGFTSGVAASQGARYVTEKVSQMEVSCTVVYSDGTRFTRNFIGCISKYPAGQSKPESTVCPNFLEYESLGIPTLGALKANETYEHAKWGFEIDQLIVKLQQSWEKHRREQERDAHWISERDVGIGAGFQVKEIVKELLPIKAGLVKEIIAAGAGAAVADAIITNHAEREQAAAIMFGPTIAVGGAAVSTILRHHIREPLGDIPSGAVGGAAGSCTKELLKAVTGESSEQQQDPQAP